MIQTAAAIASRPFIHGWHHGGGGGWWFLFPVMCVLVVVAIFWIARDLGRSLGFQASAPREPASAIEILDRRFVQGEIDADEYRQRLAALHGEDH